MKKYLFLTLCFMAFGLTLKSQELTILPSPYEMVLSFKEVLPQSFPEFTDPILVNAFTSPLITLNANYEYELFLDETTNSVNATLWVLTYIDGNDPNLIQSYTLVFFTDGTEIYYQVMTWTQPMLDMIEGINFRSDLEITATNDEVFQFYKKLQEENPAMSDLTDNLLTDVHNTYMFGVGYPIAPMYVNNEIVDIEDDTKIIYMSKLLGQIENEEIIYRSTDICYSYTTMETISCVGPVGIYETDPTANLQLSPNPANSITTLSLDLEKAGELQITLTNSLGQEVLQLYNYFVDAGPFTHEFSVADLSSGTYFVRIQLGNYTKYEPLLIVK